MTDVDGPPRRMGPFESPRAFAKGCMRIAVVLTILGIAGLVDLLYMLPLAGMLLVVALLAFLAESDRLDDPEPPFPEPPAPPARPVSPGLPVAPDAPDAPDAPVERVATVERRFRLPVSVGADRVWLVGEFNDWSPTTHPMHRDGDWFSAVVELEAGRTYRYRYLLDGVRWENDWDADDYVQNEFGTEDSVACT